MCPSVVLSIQAVELTVQVLGTHLHVHSILLWGFIATAVLTAIMSAGQEFGLSRLGLPFMLGTIFTQDRRRANIVGFVLHFLIGWLMALFYALVFEDWGRANGWLGAVAGLVHGALVLTIVIPLLPAVHPRMASEVHGPTPTRWLQPPGFLALNYGRRTPLVTLLAHTVYGAIMGAFYELLSAAHRTSLL